MNIFLLFLHFQRGKLFNEYFMPVLDLKGFKGNCSDLTAVKLWKSCGKPRVLQNIVICKIKTYSSKETKTDKKSNVSSSLRKNEI